MAEDRKRALLVFAGASFRWGGQGNMSVGEPQSYDEQQRACASHVAFAEHLRDVHGIVADVLVNTYASGYVDDQRGWYAATPGLSRVNVTEPAFAGMPALLRRCCALATSEFELDAYAFVLFIRVDLVLKPRFSDVFASGGDALTFSFVCWKAGHKYDDGSPRVADLVLRVPCKHFARIADGTLHLEHDSYQRYWTAGMPKADLGFMIDTYHDSDSAKDWNPLYKIANRCETASWRDSGCTLADFDFSF